MQKGFQQAQLLLQLKIGLLRLLDCNKFEMDGLFRAKLCDPVQIGRNDLCDFRIAACCLSIRHKQNRLSTWRADGTLTSRTMPNALITDESKAITQIIEMVKERTVTSVQQTKVVLQAHSICVHGDGVHAVQFAKHARQELEQQGVTVQAFRSFK